MNARTVKWGIGVIAAVIFIGVGAVVSLFFVGFTSLQKAEFVALWEWAEQHEITQSTE